MTDESTLTDFVDESVDTGDTADSHTHTDDDDRTSDGCTHPITTYAWGTYTCTVCSESVERVWQSKSGYVCPDCKSW